MSSSSEPSNKQPENKKSTAQLEQERQEAAAQLEQILSTSRPKNLAQGVGRGVSNIVGGALGACGVAVLMPTAGLAVGLRSGGLLGGIVGVTGGAVVGLLGGVALAVGGAVSGVVQVGRGIVAVPQSIVAPSQGKWWNENEGKWVLTDMEQERQSLEGVPEDDDDILGKWKEEIDQSVRDLSGGGKGDVKDMFYYDCLEVPATAEPAALKVCMYSL